jgi:hypothetical protein
MKCGEKLDVKNVEENWDLSSHPAIDGPVHMHRHAVDAAPGRQQVRHKLMNLKTILATVRRCQVAVGLVLAPQTGPFGRIARNCAKL